MSNHNSIYIDTHCHLDLYNNVDEVIRNAEKRGVAIIGVTNTPSVFHYTENLSKKYTSVEPAIGLHPELVHQRIQELPQLWEYLKRVRFVGEIGLDYSTPDQSLRQLQRDVFTQIIDRSAQYPNKILTIHSRRSASDVISIIGNKFPGKIILHWFSGSDKEADAAITNGYYFSFNSSMVQTKRGQSLALKIPKHLILTETDGPFVTNPSGPVQPNQIPSIVEALAGIYVMDPAKLSQQIWTNYLSLSKK